MTRKRYIKLAMSRGMSRNEANKMSAGVSAIGSYEELNKATAIYLYASCVSDGIKRVVEWAQEVARKIIDAFQPIAKAISDWLNRVYDSMAALPPHQRYKVVKKLGADTYPTFFQRKQVYHCRNNC